MFSRPDQQHAWKWSVVVAAIGLIATILATQSHLRFAKVEREAQFERQSALTFNAIRQQVEAGGQLVRAVQSSFVVAPNMNQESFEQLYANLNPRSVFPGMQAMALARRNQLPGRPPRYITDLVAPVEGNESVFGLDVATQPRNLAALRDSERRNLPVMSEPFILVQDRQRGLVKADGMAIRLPIFGPAPRGSQERPRSANHRDRGNGPVLGSVAISFRISSLIAAALPKDGDSGLAIEVRDVTSGQDFLLYQSSTPDPALPSRVSGVDFGNRVWQVSVSPRLQQHAAPIWPWVTFGAGTTISLLLSFLVFGTLRTRMRALLIAREMTTKYRESEERFRLLNENLPGLVILATERGEITYANRSSRERLRLTNGSASCTVMEAFSAPGLLDSLNHLPEGTTRLSFPRLRLQDRNNNSFWASLSFSRLDLDGAPHILALGSDVSEIIEMSEQLDFQSKQLHFQATHDQLTGLVNRRDFESHLEAAIAVKDRGGPDSALLYIDLDQFKVINDTSGHIAGDRLLVEVSERLRDLLSTSDVFARLGGDEFGVLSPNATLHSAQELAERVRQFFEDFVFNWKGTPYQVTCSMGVTLVARAGLIKEDLMSRADAACYLAKDRGRNRWQFIDEDSDDGAARRLEMEWVSRIRQAITENRLCLYYQDLVPLVDTGEEGAHFEILLRMEDENGAMVPAGEFIPAAERYGLMPLLDRWVVNSALANFNRLHPSKVISTCAINLSGDTVDNLGFEEFILDALRRYDVEPHRICFEITETAAIRNMERAMEFIPRLRATGCRLALDDFGAGMSSFGYLKKLKVDIIKIDGSFIRDLEHDMMSHSIVRAVTEIAQKMKMQVVAEWVGSDAAVSILRRMGVTFGQGFHLHKPTPCPIQNKPDQPSEQP